MGKVIIKLKVMPESPETDLSGIESATKDIITEFAGETAMKFEKEPIAFGLVALMTTFAYEEDLGGSDSVEEKITALEGVNSVDVVSVGRA